MNCTTQYAETQPVSDKREIIKTLGILFEPGQMIHVRGIDGDHVVSGFFSDHAKIANEVCDFKGNVYVGLNPFETAQRQLSERLARGKAVADRDIRRFRWLLLDFDPVRPAGVSSTNDEKAAAFKRAEEVTEELRERGWPRPLIADSGNGFHLLFRTDLPNDDSTRRRISQTLRALDQEFSTEKVKIDVTVGNASRITKLYGTLARKGNSTVDRPHRISRLIDVPDAFEIIPAELLNVSDRNGSPIVDQAAVRNVVVRGEGVSEERMAELRRRVASWEEAIEGEEGNRKTNAAARRIVDFANYEPLSEDQGWELLVEFNQTLCSPTWDEHSRTGANSLQRIWEAAKRDGYEGYRDPTEEFSVIEQSPVAVIERNPAEGTPIQSRGARERILESYRCVTVDELDEMDLKVRFLIDGLMVEAQPMVIGAASKSLKTSLVISACVSLTTGTPFASHAVPTPKRVLLFSGESGFATIRSTIHRIAASRNLNTKECQGRFLLCDRVPPLGTRTGVQILWALLNEHRPDVVFIDPAYQAFGGDNSENLFAFGEKMRPIIELCRKFGTTLAIIHHVKRSSQDGKNLRLEDLAWSGWAEFAGQWWLISRQTKFDGRTHKLQLEAGSRAGFFKRLKVDVDETSTSGKPEDRIWRETWQDESGFDSLVATGAEGQILTQLQKAILSELQANVGIPVSRRELGRRLHMNDSKLREALRTFPIGTDLKQGRKGRASYFWTGNLTSNPHGIVVEG